MAKKQRKPARPTLADQLRSAIAKSGVSHYRIAKDTGVSQPIVTRFVNDDRGLSLETADKLSAYFGMSLTPPRFPIPAIDAKERS